MVAFDKTDLEFVLAQILMAESGQPPVNPHLAFGLREVAGTNNNAVAGQETFGAADQAFPTETVQYFQTVSVNVDGTVFDPNPGVDGDTMTTSYASTSPGSIVVDTAPRAISNLISDISADNPAALQAAQNFGGQLGDGYTVLSTNPTGIVLDPGPDGTFGTADDTALADPANLFIGNITPDAGLSAPFNSWMTFFGQFFDHGLDLITKGGSGTVFIPLLPDDPLYVPGNPTNFMVLTRASSETVLPGPDGVVGTSDDIHQNINTTTPFVDQNQTYTSAPSHQVFLREYMVGVDGKVHSTGKLLKHAQGPDGVAGTADDNTGMATWADVKANALKLGIVLTDYDVGNVPLLATDAYGNFLPNPVTGNLQFVVDLGGGTFGLADAGNINPANGPLTAVGLPANVVYTGHAFINDTAFLAVPFAQDGVTHLAPDADATAGNAPAAGEYDDELLNAHYIAGDGRANENIALTAVHTIFHDEHNRLIEQVKDLIRTELANGDTSFALNWVLPGADLSNGIQDDEWNGERLFQVAKFGTETQYQHLVFEEFARKIAPTIHLFGNVDIHLDAAIVSEFANAVYRFGHSMLDENVPMFQLNPDGTPVIGPDGQPIVTDVGLIQAFTNPLAFAAAGAGAAAQIVQGTTHQIGSEIDEFVTGALRNNLLGLPLDLAALNIARGRDTGVPPINLVRNEIYSQTHDTNLKPYESWDEFRQFLKHDASIVNFLAAYGTHASIAGATALVDKRAAALALVENSLVGGATFDQDAFDFMHSLGAYANDVSNPLAVHAQWSTGSITGLDNVDLWIGGLAEKQNLFGGLLGSTFNFIFETQLEHLQDGDRLYYLPRVEGIHFGSEIEANSFAELIMNNTGAKHLSASIFLTPEYTVEAGTVTDDPATWLRNPVTGALLVEKLADGTVHFIGDDNFFGNTMVLGGTEGNDRLLAGQADDDTVWGDGGDDWLDGGNGNDFLYGGTGNDTITDSAGDDVIHGDAGNDTLHGGIGDDVIFGGDGDDFIDTGLSGGLGADVAIGGVGRDIIIGGDGDDELEGNEGDDWIEGGEGGDLIVGDQGAPTGQVPLFAANDVLIGGAQGDRMQGFSGDDIMLGQGGFDRFEGRLGYDWASFEPEDRGVSVDMERREFVDQPQALGGDAIRDFFIETEAISGSAFGDVLQGTVNAVVDTFNELSNVNLIAGLADYFPEGPVAFSGGNIMFGGGGSDFIEGRGGNDIIDGDARLHVGLTSYAAGAQIVREVLFDQVSRPAFDSLTNDVVQAGDIDTAVFADVSTNYQITLATDPITGELLLGTDGNFVLQVTHTPVAGGGGGGGGGGAAAVNDGTDTLYNIERLQFADLTMENPFATIVTDHVVQGSLTLLDNGTPVNAATVITVGDTLTFTADAINDFEGVLVNGVLDAATAGPERIDIPLNELSLQWQYQDQAGVGGVRPPSWIPIVGATGPSFSPTDAHVGVPLRVVAAFIDGLGVKEIIVSAPTSLVVTNPVINHAPTIATQVALPGLPDTTGHEDTPLGTVLRPGITLPLLTVFTDDTTPANRLVYTATLANGDPLEAAGLAFSVLLDAAGLVLAGKVTGTPLPDFTGPIDIRVTATDAGGLSVTDTFAINILPGNDGPAELTIDGTPVLGETLTALLGADPDGPGTTPAFQWLRDGIAVQGATASAFALTVADVGHVISVRAAYVDGQGFAESITSLPTALVGDPTGLPPAVIALSSIAGEDGSVVADLLSGASDPDATPISVVGLDTTVTTAGGRTLALGTDFTLTGSTLALAAAGMAQFDGLAAGEADTATFNFGVTDGAFITPNSLSLTINGVNDAPVADEQFEVSSGLEDTEIAGVLLPGSDADGDTLSFQEVAGSAINGSVAIDASTGAYVFTPTAGYAGPASFSYVVDDGTASSAPKTVFLTVDAVDDGAAPLTISGTATEGQTLSAVLGTDPDGAGSEPIFQWFRDGTAILGATASTLLLSADDVGHAISATASYVDAQGFDDLAQSSSTGSVLPAPGITLTGTNAANTLTGTGGADTLSGLGGNDTLNGLAGFDILLGGAGADTLNGGDGGDTLVGGAGNDRVNGGNDDDTISYAIGSGADTIDGGAGIDTLNITGSARNETLTVAFDGASITAFNDGNSTSSVTEVEVVNADLLGSADSLSYGTSAAGVTVDLAGGLASGFGMIANVLNVTGGSGSDSLTGDAGANRVNGGAGDDTLTGGTGNDTLTGGNGNDRFMAAIGDGNDNMNGGAGVDTYDLSATSAAATINLSSGRASSAETGNDRLSNVENVLGSQGATIITGSNAANVLEGLGSSDTISGGSGADTLVGGTGDDRLTGGAGNDTFVFRPGFGNDVVTDFHFNGNNFNTGNANHDTLDLQGLGLTSLVDLIAHSTFTTAGGTTTTHITVGDDTITLQGADIRLLNTAAHAGDFIF